jgi:hypothetical protein
MPNIERVVQVLEHCFLELDDAKDRKNALEKRNFLSEADYDRRMQEMKMEIR